MNEKYFSKTNQSPGANWFLLFVATGLGFFIGLGVGMVRNSAAAERQTAAEKPVYLIASWQILHPNELKPFGEAVIPLAKQAGWTPMAEGHPEVLEGEWPEGNVLFVQKYDSLSALTKFWRSTAHAEVVKLREGHVKSEFVVAVEAHE